MTSTKNDRIVLCQPDNIKGCSLCCGLFNFRDISSGFLSQFLKTGKEREEMFATYNDCRMTSPARDQFAHICPYQGFLNNGRPGCLIHPLSSGTEGRGRSLFASKICGEFFCPAHAILTEDEKLFLIKNVSDWYLYSVAIADPESYSFIYNFIKDKFSVTDDQNRAGSLLNVGLASHAETLAAFDGVIFFYSIPEYNINKKNFCIRYINETRDLVVSRIINSAGVFNLNQN
jgi:hypothetical protein